MNSTRIVACAAMVLALLSGCDDDDAPAAAAAASGGATVTGGVVKGPVSGSTVCAYAITGGVKGAKLTLALPSGAAGSISGGCYVTPANGAYNFALPANTTGDVLLEATGGTFCSNEQIIVAGACSGGGTVLNLGGAVLTSVVNVAGATASVYTTPLTTAAVNAAGGALSGTTFNAQFNTLAGRVIGPSSGVTPQTQPTATNQPYLTQVATYIQGGGTLTSAVSSLQQGTTTFPPPGAASGSATTSTATISSTHIGTRALKFYVRGGAGCGTYCSYTDGQDLTVVISGSGDINIGGLALSNPFVINYGSGPNLHEISWYDAAQDIEYALSDNAAGGVFSEINVYKGRQPTSTFLGQIRQSISGTDASLQAIAGTYTQARQYAGGDDAWTSVTVATDGRVSFTGGIAPSISSVSTVVVFPSADGQVVRVYSATDLNGHGVDSYDQVYFMQNAAGKVTDIEYYNSDGRIFGFTVRKTGDTTPVAIIADPRTATWAITPGMVTGTLVDTSSNDLALGPTTFNGSSSGFLQVRAVSGNLDWVIRLDDQVTQSTVDNKVNFSCVHGARDGRAVSLALSASSTASSRNGGNCNIVITSITFNAGNANQIDAISGRFSAEMYTDGRTQAYLVNNGAFSWTRPLP